MIENMHVNFINTNSNIMSPIIISNNKLLYCGGIVNNNKIIYFDENIIEMKKVLDDKRFFKHIFKTMLPYEKCFFIKGIYLYNFNNILDTSIQLKNNITVDVYNMIEQCEIDNYTENIMKYKGFTFEKDSVREILDCYSQNNFFSLKFCGKKNLNISDNKNILIIEQCIIRPDKDCGAVYTLNIIKFLIHSSYNVYYLCTNHEYEEKYTKILQKMGVYVFFLEPYSTEKIIKENYNLFDYVLINRLEGMKNIYRFVKKYCICAKIIYNTHDVHFIRNERENLLLGNDLNNNEKH
jgi:hypothetical protein